MIFVIVFQFFEFVEMHHGHVTAWFLGVEEEPQRRKVRTCVGGRLVENAQDKNEQKHVTGIGFEHRFAQIAG